MRKFTFKSLLIAAALCLGTSAWADTFEVLYGVPTYASDGSTITSVTTQSDFTGDANEKTDVAFADGNNNSAVFPISGSVLFAKGSAWTKYFSSEVTKGKVYFSCIYSVSANNAGTWRILGNDDQEIFVSMNGSNSKNGTYDYATICGTGISGYVRQPRLSGYGVDICIDLDTRVITYSLTRSSGNGSYSTDKGTISIPVEFTSVKGLSVSKTNYGAYMDNVMLYSQVSEIEKYPYTINYILGDATIKNVQANAPKGTVITAEKSFYDSNDVKYYIDEDPLPTMTISENGDNVLNVNVREAETWNYTVMSSVGNYKVTAGTAIEGENVSVAFPRLINVDGTLYTSNTAGNKECLYTFNMDAADKVATINFTATDITGVVFFSEAENIEGLTADNGGQAGSRNSMKQGAFAAEDTEIVTLQAGKYKISGARSGNSGVTFAFVVNGATVSQATTSGSWGTFDGAEFNLVEEATIVLKAAGQGGNNSRTLDYIYIQKTGEATTTQSVTVGSNGIATYTPSVALDFTNATNIKAYTATVSETTVTLTETKTVAAGEGVIIKSVNGGEENETIAVANPATATEGNALVGTLVDIDPLATTDGTYNNYILNVVEGKVGFYQANNKKVAAGKAYLQVPAETVTGAKTLTIVWNDGETTGIEENYEFGTMNSDAATFDLSGRKVANPAKGLYIKNGKKFIVK